MKISDIRKEYSQQTFNRDDLAESPFELFDRWFHEAVIAAVLEPNGMILATASKGGIPSSRTVLLKGFDDKGLVFFTNYGSRKAKDIDENPWVSATFWWKELERQVHISGIAAKVSQEESRKYFADRPRESQIGSLASRQDAVILSRSVLEKEFLRLQDLYREREVPLPDDWGGFRIKPVKFEFWQGRISRLHDRFLYSLEGDFWKIDRLSP